MNTFEQYEVWFVTGAQLLYGGDAVIAVDAHSNEMVKGLNDSGKLPVKVVYKGTVNSSKEVTATFKAANNDDKCIGVITWMHTFSPAKMWIHGLQELKKPLLHFHTQFNKEIPWETMDMDFMNLNQSAHGDREFGHIVTRMRKNRKVVVGHWQDEKAQNQIAAWMRVAAAWADAQDMLIIRFGDQMNNVAVTDGDKVSAEQVLGYHVDYYPIQCCQRRGREGTRSRILQALRPRSRTGRRTYGSLHQSMELRQGRNRHSPRAERHGCQRLHHQLQRFGRL